MARLATACTGEHHRFWPCDLSLLDSERIDGSRLHGPRQVTDAYLLALAVRHGGRFATFDRSIPVSAVPTALDHHRVVI